MHGKMNNTDKRRFAPLRWENDQHAQTNTHTEASQSLEAKREQCVAARLDFAFETGSHDRTMRREAGTPDRYTIIE